MTSQSFLIGPVKEGLRKDVKPFAIPEDAFEVLTNAFQWRGRVIRRYGYTSLDPANSTSTRLSPDGITFPGLPVMGLRTRELFGIDQQDLIGFDTTSSYRWTGTAFNTLPSVMPVTWNGTNSDFFYTINYANAFWATNGIKGFHGWAVTLFANQAGVGTAATVDVSAGGNTAALGDYVYFLNLQGAGAANNLVFGKVIATGNPTFKIQAFNVDAAFVFTNGVVTGYVLDSMKSISGQDGIRYYANCSNVDTTVTAVGPTWVNYNPPIDGQTALCGALLMFAYRGYLVFLNTWEGNSPTNINQFPNRARWTQVGTPFYSNPVPNTPNLQGVDPLAVRDDLFGRGGANDAPTNEVIVAAGFIRDILVVYFTRSTWRLRFVNNAQNPFVWERVNVEYGSDSTFSALTFDKGLMTIGDRGIVISDANDTVRFDEKIPDDIFDIRQSQNGFKRVYGLRTFRTRLCYWTIPDDKFSGTFPDRVLVYNYDTKNWSYFDDTFTCFGFMYPTNATQTWEDLKEPWSSYGDIFWDSGTGSSGFETPIAGNQQGYVFALEQTSGSNSPSLSITDIVGSTVTCTNHNLKVGQWIQLSGINGTTYSDGVSLNGRNFKLANPTLDANNFILTEFAAITPGNASGTSYTYTVPYVPIVPGSVQINVGALQFNDTNSDGILFSTGANTGTIDYTTGALSLSFSPAIASTAITIRLVSYDPEQSIVPVDTTGAYVDGGEISLISNFDIQSKVFNFFNDDKRARLSKIDFYVDKTDQGEFTCNVFADSSDTIVNAPLPDNLQSNVVSTKVNPYQFGGGDETITRLYADAIAQTIQLQLTMNDQQQAVTAINSSDFSLVSMIVTMRKGGRLV